MKEPPLTDLILATDILAEYIESAVGSAKGGVVTFDATKIYRWCVQRGFAELLAGEVKRQIKKYLDALCKAGALRKEGRRYALTSDSPLWQVAIRGLARVHLSNILSVPELPPGEEESVVRKRQLKALVELAKRVKSVDDAWISKICRLLAQECTGERMRTRLIVLRTVEGVERELGLRIQQWRGGWPEHSEVWAMYSRLIGAIELLMEAPDKVAAERLCVALERVRKAELAALYLAAESGAGPK